MSVELIIILFLVIFFVAFIFGMLVVLALMSRPPTLR